MPTWSCHECGVFDLQVPTGPVRCPHTPGANTGVPAQLAPSPLLLRQRRAWRDLHRYALTQARWRPAKARAWFEKWLERVKTFSGCSCGDNLEDYLTRQPIETESPERFFQWSVDLHNWVNARLNKPQLDARSAAIAHDVTTWRPHQQRSINLVAITSISLNPVHADVQMDAILSWRRAGLSVAACNDYMDHQLTRYEGVVDHWIWTEGSRPSIGSMIRGGAALYRPMLLINSDIHIHGDNSRLQQTIDSGKVGVGIRWNYRQHWRRSDREPWGLDAFLLQPRHVRELPALQFVIGQPVWDYWLPVHFESRGIEMDFIGEPFLFHRSHPIQWQPDSVGDGHRVLARHYGPEIGSLVDMRMRWPYPPKQARL